MQARGRWVIPHIGRTPVADTGPELQACARCGHPGQDHRHPGRCSQRAGWRRLWRRCGCDGYSPAGYTSGVQSGL